jgi:FG-GAP repeat
MYKTRLVHVSAILACCALMCTLASAADQQSANKLSDLPLEAQQAISTALARDSAAVQDFTLTASDGANDNLFGASVAIDGNTVVVGAYYHLGRTGEAYVFVKPASGWKNMTQTAKLTASDGSKGDDFGQSVSISGNTVVIGAPSATVNGNSGQGAAYVFVESSEGWTNMTETAKVVASDGFPAAVFGSSVAVGDNTVVAGAPALSVSSPGSAYIFVEPKGGWTNMTQTAELMASSGVAGDDFGNAVSISGSTVIVGAYEPNLGPGAAYIFVEPQTGWANMTETAALTASDGLSDD